MLTDGLMDEQTNGRTDMPISHLLYRCNKNEKSVLGLHCLHMSFCQKLWCTKLGHLQYEGLFMNEIFE